MLNGGKRLAVKVPIWLETVVLCCASAVLRCHCDSQGGIHVCSLSEPPLEYTQPTTRRTSGWFGVCIDSFTYENDSLWKQNWAFSILSPILCEKPEAVGSWEPQERDHLVTPSLRPGALHARPAWGHLQSRWRNWRGCATNSAGTLAKLTPTHSWQALGIKAPKFWEMDGLLYLISSPLPRAPIYFSK